MIRERSEVEETLLSQKNVTGSATRQEGRGNDIEPYSMRTALPRRLCARVPEWPAERQSATVGGVLVLARTLHHASFVIRHGWYFVRRLLQLYYMHLSGAERARGRRRGAGVQNADGNEAGLRLSREIMAAVGW